jgi:hypothetical protein
MSRGRRKGRAAVAAAVTTMVLVAACGRSTAGASRGGVASTAHTFEIDSIWTGQGQPTVTQRRVIDDDRHLGEIFPSSHE